ncbi:MAG: ferric reductase-like transmembrane domain-containing protein [Gemmatimonadaceae bacterium]
MNVRRWRRNLILGGLIVAGVGAGYVVAGVPRPVEALSFATAYVALGLLAATLSTGPRNVIEGAPNPVSTHLRRDLGISAALVGSVHTVLGLQVHKGGDLAGYFVPPWPARLDAALGFVATNCMGALATVVLVMLLLLSNDYSLRRLGTARWKRLQRSSYLAMLMVALHGAIYQLLEKRSVSAVLFFAMLVAGVLLVQLRGVAAYRGRSLPG